MHRTLLTKVLITGALLAAPLPLPTAAPRAATQTSAGHDAIVAPVLPTRRSLEVRAELPPVLPPGADRVTPLTFEAVVRRQPAAGPPQTFLRTVSRTVHRIHVATGDGREWLFERNPRDPQRVTGFLVDPAGRAIVVHDESDLRRRLGIRGWADVLTAGFDVEWLEEMTPTGETRLIGGIPFARFAADPGGARPEEAWWSGDQLLPGAFVSRDDAGSIGFSIRNLRTGVDASLLESPAARFPDCRVVDLADWLEGR